MMSEVETEPVLGLSAGKSAANLSCPECCKALILPEECI
jgi:hypothetical protein